MPAQYAGVDAGARLEVLKAVAEEGGATLNEGGDRMDAAERSASVADYRGQCGRQVAENLAAL